MSEETDWKHVSAKVAKPQYDEWEQYLEESNEYTTWSELVRTAIQEKVQGGDTTAQAAQAGERDDKTEKKVGELTDTLESMQYRMERLEGSIQDATAAMQTAESSVPQDVTTGVWEAIPRGPSRATTADDIAGAVDADASTVRVALEQLHDSTSIVAKYEIEEIEEGDGMTTVTDHQGRELEIEDPGTAIKRRNPLWYREE